jgi:hypothetical protein
MAEERTRLAVITDLPTAQRVRWRRFYKLAASSGCSGLFAQANPGTPDTKPRVVWTETGETNQPRTPAARNPGDGRSLRSRPPSPPEDDSSQADSPDPHDLHVPGPVAFARLRHDAADPGLDVVPEPARHFHLKSALELGPTAQVLGNRGT